MQFATLAATVSADAGREAKLAITPRNPRERNGGLHPPYACSARESSSCSGKGFS